MQEKRINFQLIQLLRGIASIIVVLLHITINYSDIFHQTFLNNIFKFGGSGVDIFFVLSGFIITYSNLQYIGDPSALGKFLKRRFIRIFPIYWIVISVFLTLQLTLPAFYKVHFDTGWANVLQTYFLLPGHIMLNGVSWSLTNELFFYLLFAIALIIPNKMYSFSLLVAYFVFLLVHALTVPALENANQYKEVFMFPMNIEFLMGVLIAIYFTKMAKQYIIPTLLVGILLYFVGAFLNDQAIEVVSNTSNQTLNRVLLFGFPAFLIILSIVKLEMSRVVKVPRLFLELGNASYSIYLVHLPLIVAFFKVISKFHLNNAPVLLLCSCAIFVLVCLAGIFIYHTIEAPLIRRLNRLLIK